MTTKSDMLTSRATAGTRYAAAITELRAAYVDLAALDGALRNKNFGVGDTAAGIGASDGFNGRLPEIPLSLRHGTYASDPLGAIDNDVDAQTLTYLAALQAG
ncbi:hypothetical protein [Nitrobacter sp. Nb-311A]|uniref:hypothetical protein n=1 Tax=Nitrobacter sp. Nb-311A TaxID=314253 RepID=UPI001039BCD3|nr:hypothetical protein [Nitrobacter sp. Nb-311A]